MAKSDKTKELKALKKGLRQEQRKNKTLEEKYNNVRLQNRFVKDIHFKNAEEFLQSISYGGFLYKRIIRA